MNQPRERVLLVENDPEVCDLIARQTLQPLGYHVQVVGAAGPAIQEAVQFSPDVILANLKLPGLSGKDLLVALSSKGLEVPIVVITEKGTEGDVIQAFRLGASDYLTWPIREAEVVSAVERVLKQVRARREREVLARQLKQTNQELQRRVREMTTLLAIGKAVTSITNQRTLLDKILEGAVYVTEADSGWILLREERGKTFVLSACHNLPKTVETKINQPWDDGISSLVALSGESLSISGEPLKRFKVARLGESVLVVPIKVKKEVVGLLVVVRKVATPFGPSNQSLLEAVGDYASISLVNAHLFRVLEERARSMQQVAERAQINEHIKDELLRKMSQQLSGPVEASIKTIAEILADRSSHIKPGLSNTLQKTHDQLYAARNTAGLLARMQQNDAGKSLLEVDLNDLARQSISRFQNIAAQSGVVLIGEVQSNPVRVEANPYQISRVIDSMVDCAIQSNRKGEQVNVRVETVQEGNACWGRVTVTGHGAGISKEKLPHIFERSSASDKDAGLQDGGMGISLPLAKDIIDAYKGKIWVESTPDKGSSYCFSLISLGK